MAVFVFAEPADGFAYRGGEVVGHWIYPMEFGSWKLVANNLTLKHKSQYWEIDLERCNTSAQILDWIFHMRGKGGWTDKDTLDLLAAFEAILDPRSNFCSFGVERNPEGGAKPIVENYLSASQS